MDDHRAQLTSTVENYLKCLYEEQQHSPGELVGMGHLATAMRVSPGTATAMVKALDRSGYVRYEPRGGSALTEAGEEAALRILRRHRILEQFLVETLGLDWSEVHEEAERLEHAISDKVLERLDALLGHPTVDPHGDPIPDSAGAVEARQLLYLHQCEAGVTLRVARVMDESPAFLQLLGGHGLVPGARVTIIESNPAADAMTLETEAGARVTLGTQAAAKLRVELDRGPSRQPTG